MKPNCASVGLVLREQGMAATEDQDRVLRVDRQFSSFTAWNLDKPPSADDKINKTLQWLALAKALHRPVDEDSSSQRSVTGK
ncbi:hypothetical protein BaRGS_00003926 [Batillaria attramentaria]|uniref:Uncharacterized protein n=1 Tax=Batillaria attramentaria TaxID=370345 RepID=A0ABD0M0I5_9CAEN